MRAIISAPSRGQDYRIQLQREMTKHPKRPRDPAQLAKLIVDIATGEVEDREPTPEEQGRTPPLPRWGVRVGPRGRLR
jgi:hypothetical protein